MEYIAGMDNHQVLEELYKKYISEVIPGNIGEIIEQATGIRLKSNYIDIDLDHPLMVAPGQLTLKLSQVESVRRAGFAGCVLKSVVGEAPDTTCSMSMQRKKPTSITSFYEEYDTLHECPIIHWNGRCDVRSLDEYMIFARDVKASVDNGQFLPVASLLCHLPLPGAEFKEEEWIHTTKTIFDAGYTHIEIDFCPFLSGDNYTEDQKNVLRWYRTCPGFMKSVSSEIRVIPKMLNLAWGLEFQTAIAEAAVEGGADGIIVANRIFKPEYGSGHGGEELRLRNLQQIREIKKRFSDLHVSATGGVYNGRQAWEYLQAGADNVQVLSYLMGKVQTRFDKLGNKYDTVLHKLLLHPETGLVAAMMDGPVETSK
jgi:hypothetical protein